MVIDGTDPFAASKPDARLDDCRGKGGQRGPVNREVTHDCGDKAARRGPQRQAQEKAGAVLRKTRGQDDDRHCADYGADHAERALAQRGAETWLTNDCGRNASPLRIVELKPIRDVKREADS
jgi:hypothetical protein